MHFRPSVVHINDERATSTDLSIIDLDRIWDSLVSTSGSQPALSVSSSEIISSMLWISTLHKLYEDRYIECMPHYTINIVGVNEPTLKGEILCVKSVCPSLPLLTLWGFCYPCVGSCQSLIGLLWQSIPVANWPGYIDFICCTSHGSGRVFTRKKVGSEKNY